MVCSLSSASDFRRRDDDTVAALIHGPACYATLGDTLRHPWRTLTVRPSFGRCSGSLLRGFVAAHI
jgi:hypothetical protein